MKTYTLWEVYTNGEYPIRNSNNLNYLIKWANRSRNNGFIYRYIYNNLENKTICKIV